MNILFVAGSLKAGGKERRMGELIRSLKMSGKHRIYLALFEDVFDYEYVKEYIDGKYIINRNCSKYTTLKGLYNYFKKVKPEIVHVWIIRACLYFSIMRIFLNFKYILGTVADANKNSFSTRIVHTISYLLCNKIISNSEAGLIAYKVPKEKSVVIYNGFNKDRLNPKETGDSICNEFNLKNKKVITMVARLDPSKDYKMFLDVAKYVGKILPETKFLIVGKGPNEESLKRYSVDNNITNVIFCGYRNDIEAIYKASDIAVLCTNSFVHAEGISNSIMEGMACGLPVVATKGGGTAEIVKDSYNGFLIDPQNIKCMAEKLIYLIRNEEKMKLFRENALKTIEEKFTIDIMTSQYMKVYDNI